MFGIATALVDFPGPLPFRVQGPSAPRGAERHFLFSTSESSACSDDWDYLTPTRSISLTVSSDLAVSHETISATDFMRQEQLSRLRLVLSPAPAWSCTKKSKARGVHRHDEFTVLSKTCHNGSPCSTGVFGRRATPAKCPQSNVIYPL
jgi:hypothetical protein